MVPVALIIVLCLAALYRSPTLFSSNGLGSAIIVVAPLILAALALTPIALAGRGGVDLRRSGEMDWPLPVEEGRRLRHRRLRA